MKKNQKTKPSAPLLTSTKSAPKAAVNKGGAPKNPLLSPRFADIASFGRLPQVEKLTKDIDIAVVGIPFDGGTTYRPGARFAPRAIRAASTLNRNFHPIHGLNVYHQKSVVDLGDIQVNPLNLLKTFQYIEQAYDHILANNTTPIAMGGDHSVLLPIFRAIQRKFGRVGLIQFDAHTDTADQAWGEKLHHGTPVRRLIEEGILRGEDVFQIGIRGPLTAADQYEWDKKNGIRHLTIEEYNEGGLKKFLADGPEKKKIPFYLSFDIDGVDPAYAPGTGTPVVGGLTSFQALDCVRKLRNLKFVGYDLVEVCPAYDHSELTALLASALVFEFMALSCL